MVQVTTALKAPKLPFLALQAPTVLLKGTKTSQHVNNVRRDDIARAVDLLSQLGAVQLASTVLLAVSLQRLLSAPSVTAVLPVLQLQLLAATPIKT